MRFNRLDLNLLVALDQLLTLRSITLAGERMNLSQSAMSSALRRMRDYFDDPLLIQVGRQMQLTPKAAALRQPVRDILVRIEAAVAQSLEFDPAASEREFRIVLSDYSLNVLAPRVMALAHGENAGVRFRFLPQASAPREIIDRGEADIIVAPSRLLSDAHPREPVFRDRFVAVVWAGGKLAGRDLTLANYRAARHIVTLPSDLGMVVSFEFMVQKSHQAHIAASCFGFSALGGLVVGTDCIATVQAQLAALLAARLDIEIVELPFEGPDLVLEMQWHTHMSADPGLVWLRRLLHRAAGEIAAEQAACLRPPRGTLAR